MTRLPEVSITIAGSQLSGPEAGLVALVADIGLGPAIDRVRLVVSHLSGIAGSNPGDEAEVQLGYDGDLTTVLTGEVVAAGRRAEATAIEILAAPVKLSRTRVGRSYLSQSAADIVSDLAGEAGADLGDVDATTVLAAYHVDERRTAWAHVNDLAVLSGSDVTARADGALNFVAAPGGSGGLGGAGAAAAAALGLGGGLRYGANVVGYDLGPAAALPPPVAVVPFGDASSGGAERWHIVVREPDGSPAGRVMIPAALRDQDAADTMAAALESAAARRATRGRLAVVGDPALRAGAPVELADVPDNDVASLRIVRVTHRFAATGGFISELDVEAAA